MGSPIPETQRACRPDECLAEDWLGFLGHRWNALILWQLTAGPKRFSDLQASLPRISAKVLTERLAGVTARDLVRRRETTGFPREVIYALSPRGEALRGILAELYDWADAVAAEDLARHEAQDAGPRKADDREADDGADGTTGGARDVTAIRAGAP